MLDEKVILKGKGSNFAFTYIKNDNLLYITPLKVPIGSVYVKVSLTLSQNKRNNRFLKRCTIFLGHPVEYSLVLLRKWSLHPWNR